MGSLALPEQLLSPAWSQHHDRLSSSLSSSSSLPSFGYQQRLTSNRSPLESPPVQKKALRRGGTPGAGVGGGSISPVGDILLQGEKFFGQRFATMTDVVATPPRRPGVSGVSGVGDVLVPPPSSSSSRPSFSSFSYSSSSASSSSSSSPSSSLSSSGKENQSILKRGGGCRGSLKGTSVSAAGGKSTGRKVEFQPSVVVFHFDKVAGEHVGSESRSLTDETTRDRRDFMSRTFPGRCPPPPPTRLTPLSPSSPSSPSSSSAVAACVGYYCVGEDALDAAADEYRSSKSVGKSTAEEYGSKSANTRSPLATVNTGNNSNSISSNNNNGNINVYNSNLNSNRLSNSKSDTFLSDKYTQLTFSSSAEKGTAAGPRPLPVLHYQSDSAAVAAGVTAQHGVERVAASGVLTTAGGSASGARGPVDYTFFEDEAGRLRLKFMIALGEGVSAGDVLVKANMTGNRVRVVASRSVRGSSDSASSTKEEFSERYLLPMEVDPYLISARLDGQGNLFVEAPILTPERKKALGAEKLSRAAGSNTAGGATAAAGATAVGFSL